MSRVLLVDDELSVAEVIEELLTARGISVTLCSDSESAVSTALSGSYDLILLDLKMPRKNGAEVTKEIMAKRPQQRILIITGHPYDPLADEALRAGAQGLIPKPFELGKILDAIEGGAE